MDTIGKIRKLLNNHKVPTLDALADMPLRCRAKLYLAAAQRIRSIASEDPDVATGLAKIATNFELRAAEADQALSQLH